VDRASGSGPEGRGSSPSMLVIVADLLDSPFQMFMKLSPEYSDLTL
jgi:hypothetical protein